MKIARFFVAALLLAPAWAASLDEPTRRLSREILQELIEINTSDSSGSTTVAADAMRGRLLSAGFPAQDVTVLGPNGRKGNLVARLRGTSAAGLKPILIIGHLDVVEARRSDWTTDPFHLVEQGGYFYGRGTQDMKSADAIMVTTLMRFAREGVPSRPRHHSGTDRRRGKRHIQRRGLAPETASRSGGRRFRAQPGFGRRDHGAWQAARRRSGVHRKALRGFRAEGHQPRRAQLPAGAR